MKINYMIRAAQLDLARQMETLSFIRDFIDFIASNGYNTLFLYLEWRIRTKSLDLGEGEGYTPGELAEIIRYAEQRSITVIPGLATLGHADLLLKRKEFRHLSELRDGNAGRFTECPPQHIDLCPSSVEVRRLLTDYLSETAKIFASSPWIHIGADEVHNIGYCAECRKKATDFNAEQHLFLNHVKFIHSIVTKLKKRVMMWDDMFEFYPDILLLLPKDVVLVSWLYRENVPCHYSHFYNQRFEDRLALYDKLGLEYLIAPADYSAANARTFTAFAENHHPIGGLLTAWEKSTSLMYKHYPIIAGAGHLWASGNGPETADDEPLKQMFGIEDADFLCALHAYAAQTNGFSSVSLHDLTVFDFNGPDHARFHSLQTVLAVLNRYQDRLRGKQAEVILEDILFDCRFKLLKMRSTTAAWQYFKGMKQESFDMLKQEVKTAEKEYLAFYRKHRPQKAEQNVRRKMAEWRESLDRIHSKEAENRIVILFVHPDDYGAEWTRVFVNGRKIVSECFKCFGTPYYEAVLFLPSNEEIQEIRFETLGFGGQGIAYVSGKTENGNYIPAGVTAASGAVEHAEMILTNDVKYAFLGLPDVEAAYRDRAQSGMVSSLTVAMCRKNRC